MATDIVAENALPGTYSLRDMDTGAMPNGDLSVAGFAREVSVNVGETVHFCVDGPATTILIFRVGSYSNGLPFRQVASVVNTPATQPNGSEVAGSYGATTMTSWSTTSSWTVPASATSGLYIAMIRNAANTNAFYMDFTVRDDAAQVDIIYKTSDATWRAAYNHYGLKSSPETGKNVYGQSTGVGNIMERSTMVSYHRPVLTRGAVKQTYWWACELPLIVFLERNGYNVKYVTSVDLDKVGLPLLQKGTVFLSSGHDEYWSTPMRDAVETWRDDHAGRSIFMSGNEVFWKVRFEYVGDEVRMWCFKDTMPGPNAAGNRAAGSAFDPVDWTGTWMDTRWPDHRDGALLTGTKFGMNGVYDYDVVIPQNPYGGLKVWGGSSLVDAPVTVTRVLGFEGDHLFPTQPGQSVKILAAYTRAAPGGLSDSNGEYYNVPGNIEWGIIAQRYAGGGLTVGFGTCQWAWALDTSHERGEGTPVSLPAQQFTANLLRDLGADPGTLQSDLQLREITPLDDYGLPPGEDPGEEPEEPTEPATGDGFYRLGQRMTPYRLTASGPKEMTTQFLR